MTRSTVLGSSIPPTPPLADINCWAACNAAWAPAFCKGKSNFSETRKKTRYLFSHRQLPRTTPKPRMNYPGPGPFLSRPEIWPKKRLWTWSRRDIKLRSGISRDWTLTASKGVSRFATSNETRKFTCKGEEREIHLFPVKRAAASTVDGFWGK